MTNRFANSRYSSATYPRSPRVHLGTIPEHSAYNSQSRERSPFVHRASSTSRLSTSTNGGFYGDIMSSSRPYSSSSFNNRASSYALYNASPASNTRKIAVDRNHFATPVNSSSVASSTQLSKKTAYDTSGIRSYSSARALNDSSSYGSRYTPSAAASTRYGGSASTVDRYSSPGRTLGASSYSNLRYGSGSDLGGGGYSTSYRPSTRDYSLTTSNNPTRSYSYSSGLSSNAAGGSSGNYSSLNRSSYTPSSYSRSGDYNNSTSYTSRFNARRPDELGGSSGKLYTSLSDAHKDIVGRRSSLTTFGRSISVTPATPTETVQPSFLREQSADAVPTSSFSPEDITKKESKSENSTFVLAKPPLPANSAGSADPTKDYLRAKDTDFETLYDRYVTHSPILELEKQATENSTHNGTANSENGRDDDSAYSSRDKAGSDSNSQTQSRTSLGDEIEEEAEEMTVNELDNNDDETETEKMQTNIYEKSDDDETKKETENDENYENSNTKNVSRKACLDTEPPWQQFASSVEDDDYEAGEEIDRDADDELEERKKIDRENESMSNSLYESSMWNSFYENNADEEEEEDDTETQARLQSIMKPKRIQLSFADAIRKRAEEVSGVAADEEEDREVRRNSEDAKSTSPAYNADPMTSSGCWEQFSYYDDGEGDDAEGEEEAEEELPPWQQFIDYPSGKPHNKYSIQVQPANETESEYTTDDEEHSHASKIQQRRTSLQGGKPQAFMRLLAPPKDSGADTSSEVESDYEMTGAQTVDKPRTFPFLPNEQTEERGRVTEAHMAQPPPVFSIKVTYDGEWPEEEESVASISDYEDLSEEEEEDTDYDDRDATPKPLDVPQIMVTSSDVNDFYTEQISPKSDVSDGSSAYASQEEQNEKIDTEDETDRRKMEKAKEHRESSSEDMREVQEQEEEVPAVEDFLDEEDTAYVDAPTLADQKELKNDFEEQEATAVDNYGHKLINVCLKDELDDEDVCATMEERRVEKIQPEVQLYPLTGKEQVANVPLDRADRFYPKKNEEAKAVARTVKGVAETAKIAQVPTRTAPEKLEKMDDKKMKSETVAAATKISDKAMAEKLVKTLNLVPVFAKQQRVDVVMQLPEPYNTKKPTETWAKKTVVPETKLEKPLMGKSVSVSVARERPSPSPAPAEPKGLAKTVQKIEEKSSKPSTDKQQKIEADKASSKTPRSSGIVESMTNKFKTAEVQPADNAKSRLTTVQSPLDKRSVSPQKTEPQIQQQKRTSSQPPPTPPGPSFEEQMEELRKKMKSGTSQLSQQMKDMSKGIVDASTAAKLAADASAAQDLINSASNLRQQVSRQYDNWKSSAQEEMAKREEDLKKPLALKKSPEPTSAMSKKEPGKSSAENVKLQPQETQKITDEQKKIQVTPKTRQPGKVASPFAEKVKRESDLAKAAQEELAKRETAKQQILQKPPSQNLQQQKTTDLLGRKAQMTTRHEPEGESDHDYSTARKSAAMAVPANAQLASSKIMEPARKESAELAKSKLSKADLIEQATAGQAQIKGLQMQAEMSTKGKLHQAGEAALVGTGKTVQKVDETKLAKKPAKKPTRKTGRRRHLNRFIGAVQDIDDILNSNVTTNQKSSGGNNRLKTFDQYELFYENCSKDVQKEKSAGRRRPALMPLKIYTLGVKDFDEVYSEKDLRTLMGMFSPTSKTLLKFDFSKAPSGDQARTRTKMSDKFRQPGDGKLDGKKIDECALQVYRGYEGGQGDYGTYLDNETSLAEQPDELAALKDGKRTSLVLRTQLSARVHSIIEKLLNATGRELRRALFSLKQIFQDDKDLVHEFVQNDGLACLIKVGTEADQNYQNYILRAIGQVMLYVDGMNGCIAHNETIQWLYSLLASPFRLVVKTALKLLLIFVEYTESNSLLLLAAVYIVDKDRGVTPWTNLVQLLTSKDSAGGDLELLIYAMTLLNTTLNGIPDQDTYYDVVDALEEQNLEEAIKRMTSMGNTELAEQCRLYEAVLREEDGAPDDNGGVGANGPAMNIAKMRQTPRTRTGSGDRRSHRKRIGSERSTPEDVRTSQRHGQSEQNGSSSFASNKSRMEAAAQNRTGQRVRAPPMLQKITPTPQSPETPGLPASKRLTMDLLYKKAGARHAVEDDDDEKESPGHVDVNKKFSSQENRQMDTSERDINSNLQKTRCPPPALPDLSKLDETANAQEQSPMSPPANGARRPSAIGAVHSLAERYQQKDGHGPSVSAADDQKPDLQDEDEGAAGSGANTFANALLKMQKGVNKKITAREPVDTRKESDIQWEQAMESLNRPLIINDLDFTELDDGDDQDPVRLAMMAHMASNASSPGSGVNPYTGVASFGGAPPPPPMFGGGAPPPPPPGAGMPFGVPPPPRLSPSPGGTLNRSTSPSASQMQNTLQKDTKTVKLHWKEAQVQSVPGVLDRKGGVFWEKVKPVDIDVEKLSQLFETKTKEVVAKKKEDKKAEVRVLDLKRAQIINIGLTKLPPARAIKTAITKFDSSIINKEGIEKILAEMMPTEEEKERIMTAQVDNPDVPLGTAEQFLLMLTEIPQLHARLRLWLFMLNYANIEREVSEPLMDLKLAMEELDQSKTFQYVMGALLAVGNYLNGAEIKGFQIEYLAKVPEVKDTVHKHSLVYHLCTIVVDKFSDSTDLYSELGAVVRCARVDFEEVHQTLERMEKDCKASWDYLRLIAKHESQSLKQKMSEFLTDCAQRIMTLKIINRRVINRFRMFLLYMGMPQHAIKDTKVNSICKTISEFALEYRTCRDKMLQQKKRLLDKRERNKTRGKMITEGKTVPGLPPQQQQYQVHGHEQNGPTGPTSSSTWAPVVDDNELQHMELSRVLRTTPTRSHGESNETNNNSWTGSYPGARLRSTRPNATVLNNNATTERSSGGGGQESPDDEILDGLVKAATVKTDHSRVEQRRKARQFNRKSLRRTRTLKLVEDQVGGTNE